MKAVFLGLGYIGLPSALFVASKGFEVLGVDIDQSKVDSVNNNSLDIQEQGFQEMLNSALKKENFSAQTCPEEGDVFFIVVPTPVKQNNQQPDQ